MNGAPSGSNKSVVGMVAGAKAGKTAAVENAAGEQSQQVLILECI